MGPRHDESLLDQALAEPYLSTVRGEAAAARKAGWFWSYQPSHLHVRPHPKTPHSILCRHRP